MNLRRSLLRAVNAFLEATPASTAEAHRLVMRCRSTRWLDTIDGIVWGFMLQALTDSLFYDDRAQLEEFRSVLTAGSREIQRTYLNFDFRPDFSAAEQDWYTLLWYSLDVIENFPFDDIDAGKATYDALVAEIKVAAGDSPRSARYGDETIYHHILREVTAVVTNIAMNPHRLLRGYLEPDSPYASFRDWSPVDVATDPLHESLAWARRALRAIAGDGWLLITWEVTAKDYQLSIH